MLDKRCDRFTKNLGKKLVTVSHLKLNRVELQQPHKSPEHQLRKRLHIERTNHFFCLKVSTEHVRKKQVAEKARFL